jgi:hypothetical protein
MDSILNIFFFIQERIGKKLCRLISTHRGKALDMPYETDEEIEDCKNYLSYGLGFQRFGYLCDYVENNYELEEKHPYWNSQHYRWIVMYSLMWKDSKEKNIFKKIGLFLS